MLMTKKGKSLVPYVSKGYFSFRLSAVLGYYISMIVDNVGKDIFLYLSYIKKIITLIHFIIPTICGDIGNLPLLYLTIFYIYFDNCNLDSFL